MIGRSQHDQMRQGTLGEPRLEKQIDPLAHDRPARGMRDAGESFASGQTRQNLCGNRLLHTPGNIVDIHFVGKANVLSKVKISDLNSQAGAAL